jgi:hypothetical protein
MGWGSGSALASQVWDLFRKYVSAQKKKKISRKLIKLFESYDCDTLFECVQLMQDAEVPEYLISKHRIECGHPDCYVVDYSCGTNCPVLIKLLDSFEGDELYEP